MKKFLPGVLTGEILLFWARPVVFCDCYIAPLLISTFWRFFGVFVDKLIAKSYNHTEICMIE